MSQTAGDYSVNQYQLGTAAGNTVGNVHYVGLGQSLGQLSWQQLTSTGYTTFTQPVPTTPIRASDVVLGEDGVHVMVGNTRVVVVPKELLEKLEALMRMAVLAGMVCPVGE